MHDLAVVITSLNEAEWLRRCLPTVVSRSGNVDMEIVVVDIDPDGSTRALLEENWPSVRRVVCENRGYSYANNRGFLATDARYVLFLNPDTEICDGTFEQMVAALDARPDVGIAGCRQVTGDGALYPTIRRFASARRTFAEALGSERLAPRAGQRVLDMQLYDHELECDWIIGSFMMVRREALVSAGCLDERFFLYCEEEDLCRRVRQAGWDIRHLPSMTIVHHVGKAGVIPRREAQRALARLQYADKHFSAVSRRTNRLALVVGYTIRAAMATGRGAAVRREAAMAGLRMSLGRMSPPFFEIPASALAPTAMDETPSMGAAPAHTPA